MATKQHKSGPSLVVEGLSVDYGEVRAVDGVSFTVRPGTMTALVGESGSGKTTSALASIGLLSPSATVASGSVVFDGAEVLGSSDAQWRALRGRRIGLVPQDPNNSLNPLKTVGASIEEGLAIHGVGTRRSAVSARWSCSSRWASTTRSDATANTRTSCRAA